MPEDDFKQKQSEHATRIRTERQVMDMFGVTRGQARQMFGGLDSFNEKLDKRQSNVNAGRPPAPKIESEEVTSKAGRPGSMGNPNIVRGGNGGAGGATTSVLALINDGTTLTAATINVHLG